MASNCAVSLRDNPVQHRKCVRIGCGAGFAGDRPLAALKLLTKVPDMDYLVLECLAERTLAIRQEALVAGEKGYDPQIAEWMRILLPEAVKRGVCIITNMGAVDAVGAQNLVLDVAKQYHLHISVGVLWEVFTGSAGSKPGSSTYLGAAPIVKLLELSNPNVIITTRLADASLFLGPMVYELGWNWNDYAKLAQGTLAGHLLECGCQVTGGYFAHPVDEYRNLSAKDLVEMSLPYAEISDTGEVVIAKPKHTGGEISIATCSQQLLYEVGDPSSYITPDVVVDFTNVTFDAVTEHRVIAKGAIPGFPLRPEKLLRLIPEDCGWKAWGEISYGGLCCFERAKVAEELVHAWLEEVFPKSSESVVGYLIGVDSLFISPLKPPKSREALDVRLRMDGLFCSKEQAVGFTRQFEALYTNGPAGGGGISVGLKKEILLNKVLVPREETFWKVNLKKTEANDLQGGVEDKQGCEIRVPRVDSSGSIRVSEATTGEISKLRKVSSSPAPGGVKLPLYKIAHCRAGDKGNDINFSLIPHCTADLPRLKAVVTADWVKKVTDYLFLWHPIAHYRSGSQIAEKDPRRIEDGPCVEIYVARGIHALNIVVRNALDGGVTCSRRIDRHGKSLSDLFLCQMVTLPEIS